MGLTAGSATNCMLHTETMLSEAFSDCLIKNIDTKDTSLGAYRAIKDSETKSEIEVTRIGKTYPGDSSCTDISVQFKYQIPECEETEDVCHEFNCDDVDAELTTYAYEDFTFDTCVSEKFSVDETMFRCSPEKVEDEYRIKLRKAALSLAKKKNRKILEMLGAGVGAGYNKDELTSVEPLPLKIFRSGVSGELIPQPGGFDRLLQEYDNQAPNCTVNPVLISGSSRWRAFEYAKKFFKGNIDGADANSLDFMAYYDKSMTTALSGSPASEPLISFLPDSVKMLEYRLFKPNEHQSRSPQGKITWNPIKANNELVRQIVDIGPLLGLGNISYPVDMQFYWLNCADKIVITMKDIFTMIKVPQRGFCDGDLHNYCLLWDILCDTYTCLDTKC